jgi:hypothetical protein
MTGRLSAPLAVVSLVSSAILASGCVFVVDRGPDQDATFHYHSSHLNRRFEVWGAGQVTFADDDRGVAHIAPGGFLHVEERRGFRTRRVRVAPGADGRVRLTHTVNGRDQPDDADARQELARIFLQAIRRTGIGAEARVGRLLAAGGVDRVFEDLAAFESSSAVSRYLTALLAQGTLTTAKLIETADQATTRIGSSGTRASFLIEAMPYFPSGDPQRAYFEAVDSIHSSGSRARVLHAILDLEPDRATVGHVLRSARSLDSSQTTARVLIAVAARYDDPREGAEDAEDGVPPAFFEAVDSIRSSESRARVLRRVLDRDELDASTIVAVLRSTSRITSNGSKTRVLMAAVDHYRVDPAVRDGFFDAVDSITSSGDHARALVAFVDGRHLDGPAMLSLTRSVDTISSNGAKARVLVAAAPAFMNEPAPRDAFLDAVETISSSGEHARVLVSLLSSARLDDASLSAVIRSVGAISSSGEQARVLVAASDQARRSADLRAAYIEAAKRIRSDSERRRVLAALAPRESEA